MVKALVLEQQLRKYGVKLIYLSTPVEDTAEGMLLLRQLQSFAEFEREKIALRTMRGRREKIERGLVLGSGPPPYGYRYVRDTSSSRVRTVGFEPDPDPTIARTIPRIYREALHCSAADIADQLVRDGITPPRGRSAPGKRWAADVVLRILTNPVYAGHFVYGSGDGRRRAESASLAGPAAPPSVAVPPLVSPAAWDDVQKALLRRQKSRRGQKPSEDVWLLRGLLQCGHCGGQLSSTWN
jgi:site-specific DNA recombinase